jgi:hypothetical protein
MWICRHCKNESEENFKFCWSCGQSREKAELRPEPVPLAAANPKRAEKPVAVTAPPQTTVDERVETSRTQIPARKQLPVKKSETAEEEEVLPMLARVAGVEKRARLSGDDLSLEEKVFRIAVRLVGLFFIYQVLAALPDLAVLVTSALRSDRAFSDALTADLIVPAGRILFYLIVGIYLIASGRILTRLVPDG